MNIKEKDYILEYYGEFYNENVVNGILHLNQNGMIIKSMNILKNILN